MSNSTKAGVFINVDRDGYTGSLQVSIGDRDEKGCGTGHRLLGPKYMGQSASIAEAEISAYDAAGIMDYAYPLIEAWAQRREAEGFTVDRTSWPWRVFKGESWDNRTDWRQLGVGE